MKTKMPLSTVSFNSDAYLLKTLDILYKNKIIIYYRAIKHKAEAKEKKNHWHVYLEPNGRIDTDSLRDVYFEEVVKGEKKPLNCLPFNTSKFEDWELYNEHWEPYLQKKGLEKEYHYNDEDFVSSDDFASSERLDSIDRGKYTSKIYDLIRQYIEQGKTFSDMVYDGVVPINQINNYKQAYIYLSQYHAVKGKYKNQE